MNTIGRRLAVAADVAAGLGDADPSPRSCSCTPEDGADSSPIPTGENAAAAGRVASRRSMISGATPRIAPRSWATRRGKRTLVGSAKSEKHGTDAASSLPLTEKILPRFGKESFSYHLSCLAARGVPYEIVENESIGLDIDGADDLRFLLTRKVEGKTREKLLGFERARSQFRALSG
jgi:hypothetical protein